MKRPYLVVFPGGGIRVADFVFMHKDGGACFVDIGWDVPGQHPFHIIDGPIKRCENFWESNDGTIIRGLTCDDRDEWSYWQAWVAYKASPEGIRVTDELAIAACERDGALITINENNKNGTQPFDTYKGQTVSKYQWSALNNQQIGAYTEYYVKMELTMYGFEVYSTEIDDRGIDFVARKHGGAFIEIQVKSLRKYGYVFVQKSKFKLVQNVYLALGLMFQNEAPRLYFIPATIWLNPNEVFVERNYEGLKSAPEWGINVSRKHIAALEKFKFEATVNTLMNDTSPFTY